MELTTEQKKVVLEGYWAGMELEARYLERMARSQDKKACAESINKLARIDTSISLMMGSI